MMMVPVAFVLVPIAGLAKGAHAESCAWWSDTSLLQLSTDPDWLGDAPDVQERDEPIQLGRTAHLLDSEVSFELGANTQKLPSITTFTDKWNHIYANDVNRDKQPPSSVQIVFGFTTMWTATADAYWKVHKSTWMQQPGVCILGTTPRPRDACTAYVTRVVGNSVAFPKTKNTGHVYGWQFLEDDVLFLNMTENGNGGKSFWLLHVLSRSCPWATHIAKIDPDTYPSVYGLATFLSQRRGCASRLEFLGLPAGGPLERRGPTRNLSSSCTSQCFERGAVKFMVGGLYMLSNELARVVTDEKGWYASNKIGEEDVISGHAVGEYWAQTGSPCISVWVGLGLFHHKPW